MPFQHQVKPGDCLIQIAAKYGFADWKPIWELSENAELRKQRPEPTVLADGDVVFVPDPKLKQVTLATSQRHRIVITLAKAAIRIRFLDWDDMPMAGRNCILHIGDRRLELPSDGDGWLEQRVPSQEVALKLEVALTDDSSGPCYAWQIGVGYLDPHESKSGLRQRLANLGYWPPGETNELILPYSLRAFQDDHGLEMTGEPDEPTLKKLLEVHGGI